MSLDLKKTIVQISKLGTDDTRNEFEKRISSTYKLFELANSDCLKLLRKLNETNSTKKARFSFAIPETDTFKPDHLIDPLKDFSIPHIAIGTDGSQINPSSHEFTSACLVNIGFVGIPYFQGNIPVTLSSEPIVYNSLDDISSRAHDEKILDDELISYERTLKEIEELVRLGKKYSKYKLPLIALLDGTLIHWHIAKFPASFLAEFIDRFSCAAHELKELGIPLASFISNSRSNDLINMLRIFKCPYDFVDCKKYCSGVLSKDFPCNPTLDYAPVMDRKIVERLFSCKNASHGARTILFKSNNDVLNFYPDDLKVLFFYMNTGTEVARVEIPSYVAKDENMLSLLHNVLSLQCKVGFGYPVVLSEAHLEAVVNKNDRQVFYDLVKTHMLKNTKTLVKISTKELRKRISFV